ncbi:hypothetical protein [Anaeromyxobacter oryzae]|uniref:hypothetical protein n=1 Tax=Anaeromyxobacter oryzae TaxID=2918170 RepID=UPI0020BE6F0F|nr:hypothetical protein [Anaeromyxobacter oryzae]
MRPLLLAALVALAPAAAIADEDELGNEIEAQDTGRGRLALVAWGGQAFDTSGSGPNVPLLGGEVAWAFDQLDLGVAGYGYRDLRGIGSRSYDPVVLARVTQRFETYRGVDAGITIGVGAAREDHWRAWFQFALGLRLNLGPVFIAGELGFEQQSLLRLAGGVGVRLF